MVLACASGLEPAVAAVPLADYVRAEAELRASQHRFAVLFEEARDAIIVADADSGVVVDANAAATRLINCPREQLIGRRNLDLHPADRRDEVARSFRLMVVGEQPCAEMEVLTADGRRIPVEIVGGTVTPFGGRRIIAGSFRDVSGRVRAEAALAETARRHATLLNNLPGFAFRCGNDHDWTVEYVSRGVEVVTGYPAADFEGNRVRTYNSIIEPADRERVWAEVQRAFQAQATYVVEYRIHTAAGAVRWVWEKGTGIVRDGTVVALEGFVTDITERRQAQEEKQSLQAQFLQAQKMETIGRLAGGVAHDFNNLLTVILGYCEVLQGDVAMPSQRADLEQIREAGERARALTRQLLAFGRKQILELRRLSLNRVVTDFGGMLSRLIGEQIRVEMRLDPGLGWANADASQVVQVLLNLAVNARDAMPAGGTLTIQTANLSQRQDEPPVVAGLAPGEYVQLTVADTGCGMDAETQRHVFEPFFTTKAVGKGSGLGLATVYGVVQQHGGHVWFESRSGVGTTFHVCLPRVAPAASATTAAALSVAPGGGTETILLVEDDDDVRQMAALFLRRYGYDVLTAAAPRAALHLAESQPRLDLVVTDVVMPELSGREVVERIAALRPGVRALYLSGYAQDIISRRGVLDDGVVFLQKPFSAAALAGKVREVLDGPVVARSPAVGT